LRISAAYCAVSVTVACVAARLPFLRVFHACRFWYRLLSWYIVVLGTDCSTVPGIVAGGASLVGGTLRAALVGSMPLFVGSCVSNG